jgi:hypothetical protein
MPYAKTRKSPMLNKAYAYVVSPHFGEAAAALTEKLVNKGFDSGEARAAIQLEQSQNPGLDPNWIICTIFLPKFFVTLRHPWHGKFIVLVFVKRKDYQNYNQQLWY